MSVEAVMRNLPALQPGLEALYQDLHRHPELSMREERTRGVIAQRLGAAGYQVHRLGGGVVGVMTNGEGPTVLLRADMDGLPVQEETGLPYASTDTATDDDGRTVPVMHACGHDVHVTGVMGAAELMARAKDAWQGTLEVLFQPGEEKAAGARAMVADGLVDRIPKPAVCLGQHVLGVTPAGTVATAAGPVLSTAASIKVTIHGKGSHGSMPHLGVDPVLVASSIVVRLQSLVSREVAPGDFAVVTVGSLQAGATANTIPETATLLLNIRAYRDEVRDHLLSGVERIVTAECEAGNCPQPPGIEVFDRYPATTNDEQVTRTVRDAFVAAMGEGRVRSLPPQTASEDFSVIPDAFGVPYTYWGLGGFTDDQEVHPNHNPMFGPAMEPTLATGTEAMVAAAMAWLAR